MAFSNEKYRVHVDHQFGGDSRYVQIYADGWTGAVTELTGGVTPAILEYPGGDTPIFEPIYGAELTVNIMSLTDQQFIEFATAKNKQYLAVLYNDTQGYIEFQGWLVPSEYEESYNQPPYETTLIFNCGLGMLSAYDYLNGSAYYVGRATEIAIITNILQMIYPTTLPTALKPEVRVSISLIQSGGSTALTSSAVATSYVDQGKYINDDGTVWTALDVLKDILLTYGARIATGLAGWWIVRMRDYAIIKAGNEISYQKYTHAGAYSSNSSMTAAQVAMAMTGPQARDTMIGWVERSQRVRYERAFREIILNQDYVYRNMIVFGDFRTDQWTDFWTVNSTVTRTQSPDNPDVYQVLLGTASSYLEQTINNMEGTGSSPYQILKLTFEAMVEWTGYTTVAFGVRVRLDFGGGVLYYLDGDIGGASPVAPHWQVADDHVTFSGEGGPPISGQWYKFELVMPYLSGDCDIDTIRFEYVGTAGSGTISGVYYKNIKLFGSYDSDIPTKENLVTQVISTDNIMPGKDFAIALGDINTEQGNECKYWQGSKSTDSGGATKTSTWRSTYKNASVRSYIGPAMSLADYLMDGYIVQHGINRQRITGRLTLDTLRWAYFVISTDSKYFLPTSLAIDLKRGLVDISAVELADLYQNILDVNLITSWTNLYYDVWSATGANITSAVDTSAPWGDAPSNSISYVGNVKYRIQVTGTFDGTYPLHLVWGTINQELSNGLDVALSPSTTDGSASAYLRNVDSAASSNSNILIKITRAYGY